MSDAKTEPIEMTPLEQQVWAATYAAVFSSHWLSWVDPRVVAVTAIKRANEAVKMMRAERAENSRVGESV